MGIGAEGSGFRSASLVNVAVSPVDVWRGGRGVLLYGPGGRRVGYNKSEAQRLHWVLRLVMSNGKSHFLALSLKSP